MIHPKQALEPGPVNEPAPGDEIGWRSRIAEHLEISSVLRLLGGGFTVMAILLFLFQRWDDASDLLRYGMILGETLTLTVLGFVTSRWLKEQKSARVFLGLSLVSTSAVFTILSAMIHSQVQWMPMATNLPDFAVWAVDSLNTVMLLLGGSLVILGGQSLLSLSVLARPVAGRLTLLMLLNIGLLLLPVRDMGITTLLVLPALLFGFHYLSMVRRSTPAMRTTEGIMAGILVMLPLAIMIGRGAYLYAHGPVAAGSLAMLCYLLMRQLAVSITSAVQIRKSLEVASLLPAVLTALNFTEVVDRFFPSTDQWFVLLFGLLLCGFLLDLAMRAVTGRERYIRGIFYTALVVALMEEMFWPGVSTAMLAVVLSSLVAFYGYSAKETGLLRLSLLTFAGSTVFLISELIVTLNAGTWMSLAVLGMFTIILAATVERHGKWMMGMIERLKS
ncbi:MAG: hypothetical protein KZQ93_05315 [Candidatus Thiodiazotropha sp. (ex Monitilora ramsayi)]|nr:hypothetical protein [Candidatus Thiodiazotropha sp. (ex Monitilora ramsayi)]